MEKINSQIGDTLADAMRTSVECREKVLLDNNVLLAAVYVDPMYRVTLNDEERSKRKATLLQIALSLKHHEERRCGVNLFEKKIKAAEKKTFHLPQSQKMRTSKSYLTGRQSAAKLTQKMRLVIHLHFDCSKWTSTMH